MLKKFFGEFREFAMRGSVIDLAVGVVIGAAFKTIVDSLVNDIISPLLGLLGGANLSVYALNIGGVSLGYGAFITAIINFLLMAFALFLVVKAVNRAKNLVNKEEAPAPTTKTCPYCKSTIPLDATRCAHCTSEVE